jgi:hypothetical protein
VSLATSAHERSEAHPPEQAAAKDEHPGHGRLPFAGYEAGPGTQARAVNPSNTLVAFDRPLRASRSPAWSRQAGSAIDGIRINAVSREVRDGRALLVKRRRLSGIPLARTANLFFRAARHPVFVWADTAAWQRWEVSSFNLLHAAQYCAFPLGSRTVCADILPGLSLAEHFDNGTFDPVMLDAAGAELRRAHQLSSPFFGGPWSHGDPNLANFLFSSQENHARLIDFEVVHERRLPAMVRHLEDVLSFLQDLLGCAPRGTWISSAHRFLDAYGCDCILRKALRERLHLPGGVPRVWWWIRANYVPVSSIRSRLERLRESLD